MKAYLRCATERAIRLKTPGIEATEWVHSDKGLPQGCPASPVIFAVVLEEFLRDLLDRWGAEDKGLHIDGGRLALLAFADDVYILAGTAEMAQAMLGDLRDTLRKASMTLQPDKCSWMPVWSKSESACVETGHSKRREWIA